MHHYLFDRGDTLMADLASQPGPMCDWLKVQATSNAAVTLSRLSKIAKFHLATNAKDSNEAQISQVLARAGLDQWIDNIFCFRSIGAAKPSMQYFDFIAGRLSVDKCDLTMVGDDLLKDVIGAMQCGLNAIWYNPKGAAVPSDIIAISELCELPNLAQQSQPLG